MARELEVVVIECFQVWKVEFKWDKRLAVNACFIVVHAPARRGVPHTDCKDQI